MSAIRLDENLRSEDVSGLTISRSMKASSSRNSTFSPLLCLPAELREKIWHYVFSDLWITISDNLETDKLCSTTHTFCEVPLNAPLPTLHRHFSQNIKHPLALALTCRQIYSETCLLLYTLSVFEFSSVNAFGTFLSHLEDNEGSEAQSGVISCSIRESLKAIMPPVKWLDWVSEGSEPRFTSQLPNLKKIYLDGSKMSKDGFEMTYYVCSLSISEGLDVVILEFEDCVI